LSKARRVIRYQEAGKRKNIKITLRRRVRRGSEEKRNPRAQSGVTVPQRRGEEWRR